MKDALNPQRLLSVLCLALLIAPLHSQAASWTQQKSFTDPRDQQEYGTAVVDGLRWMTENLRYAAANSVCYDKQPENCEKLGRLYPWEVALQACPDGWHLATEYEWQKFKLALGVPFGELEGSQERGEPAGEKIKMGGRAYSLCDKSH